MSFQKRINLWSGPRNVSTALMYSFAQRNDSRVVDEPFYAHYLKRTGAEHPGRQEVMVSQSASPPVVLNNLLTGSRGADLLFVKNMAHHMIHMKSTLSRLVDQFEHVFLIRNPREMLLSLDKSLPNPTLRDTAYKRQFELFQMVQSQDTALCVIDSRELLENPYYILSTLCRHLDIDFQQSMLEWPPGPIPEDGIWARHWYQSVHASTGFKPYEPKEKPMPEYLRPLYEQCRPYYDKMFAHAIKNN